MTTYLEMFADSEHFQPSHISNPYDSFFPASSYSENAAEGNYNYSSHDIPQHDDSAQYDYFEMSAQEDSYVIPSQLYSEPSKSPTDSNVQNDSHAQNDYYTKQNNSSNQDYSIQQQFLQCLPVHPNKFFYQPPNDPFNYHIKCEKISRQSINKSINMKLKENEITFFYLQLNDCQCYQITCEMFSPSSINNYLNKNIYGIEVEHGMGQEELAIFTLYHKENLKSYLTQYLNHYILN